MLWVKAFHIVFVASWFAGLFYLPRIFVNLAQVPSGSDAEKQRLLLMARKLMSNLFFLSEHPHVSPPMRAMLVNLRARWQPAAGASPAAGSARQPSPLWHAAPEHVQ